MLLPSPHLCMLLPSPHLCMLLPSPHLCMLLPSPPLYVDPSPSLYMLNAFPTYFYNMTPPSLWNRVELTACNVQFAQRLDLNSKNCTSFFQTMCKFLFCNCNNQGLGIIFYVQKEDLGMLFMCKKVECLQKYSQNLQWNVCHFVSVSTLQNKIFLNIFIKKIAHPFFLTNSNPALEHEHPTYFTPWYLGRWYPFLFHWPFSTETPTLPTTSFGMSIFPECKHSVASL